MTRHTRRGVALALALTIAMVITPASRVRAQAGAAGAPPPAAAAAPAELEAYVASVMRTFQVPGLALAVVKDGRIVLTKGFGVRRLGSPEPVDEHTLFGIASNTKVFTAVALGLLVEDGAIGWDDPVVRHLPWFQMWDPWVTRELTIRDLLVHRSGLGLGAGDLLWWPESTYDRREIARRLRFIPPATSFRSAYAYDNVLYIVAGELIEAVSGQTWEDFMRTRILARVGMTSTNVLHSAAATGGNVATPHAEVDGRVQPIRPFTSDNTNAAGGINSNAVDMARWLMTLLQRGVTPDGTRLFSEATWRQVTTTVTPLPLTDPAPELAALRSAFQGYALGLGVATFRGHLVLSHTGGLPGYVSKVAMVPDAGLGIAVLTNQESGAAFNAITYHVIDAYLQQHDTDWLAAFKTVTDRAAAAAARTDAASAAARVKGTPSLPLDAYAGTYRDQWYGDVIIERKGDGLTIRFSHTPALTGTLEHWQHDTFVARWTDRELRADAFVTFALTPDGRIAQAKMQAVSPTTDFSFDFQDLLLVPVPPAAPAAR